MKTTISISLAGFRFQVTEDGYKLLSDYLCDIESRVSENPNSVDIMRGVERRIAEIFKFHNPFSVTSIDRSVVMEAIFKVGEPSKFGGHSSGYCSSRPYMGSDRRLMRDGSSGILGGVCAGIAAYYNLDLAYVRIAAFILIFFGGLSVMLYLVLWIVLPMAISPADIEMLHRNNFRRPRK